MKPMREKIQTKLNSMASILIEDLFVPEEKEQEGYKTIDAGFYDRHGNRFDFRLKLNITPKSKIEELDPAEDVFGEEMSKEEMQEKFKDIISRVKLLESYTSEHEDPVPYDDSSILERLNNLENRVDNDTIYDDGGLRARVGLLEQGVETLTSGQEDLQSRVTVIEEKVNQDNNG